MGESHNFYVKDVIKHSDDIKGMGYSTLAYLENEIADAYNISLNLDEIDVHKEVSNLSNLNSRFVSYVDNASVFDLVALQSYTDSVLHYCIDDTATFGSIATFYYSNLLWNKLAPNPYLSKESLSWNPATHECIHIVGQDSVMCSYESSGNVSLFPCFDNDTEASVLYFYVDACDTIYSEICFRYDYSFSSSDDSSKGIDIVGKSYPVHETDYYGIYYIDLQDY